LGAHNATLERDLTQFCNSSSPVLRPWAPSGFLLPQAHRINLGHMRGFMFGWLATIQTKTGDLKAALFTVEDALKQSNDVSGRAWEGELRRLRGDILLSLRPDALEEAERSYEDAIAIARKQCARSFELRATTSLAQFLRRQGRGAQARQRLDHIFGWFSEGLETADLTHAKAVLMTLGPSLQLDVAPELKRPGRAN
jgi:hypothetical protein